MSEKKELDVLDVRRPKRTKPKKRITYENTTVVLAIICSFMGVWIGYTKGVFVAETIADKILLFILLPLFVLLGICYLCDKAVKEKAPADDHQSKSRGE